MRNDAQPVQEKILQRCADLQDGQCIEMPHEKKRRLVVAYSDKRAAKDAHNRQRGLAKVPISPQRAAELTQTMYEMTYRLPNDPQERRSLLQMDEEQRRLYELFN